MKKLYTIKERVIRYLSKVNRIPQGKRNRILYRLGIRLRTKCDLRLTDIEEALASVNRTKCEEPLSESEVAQIARSVTKSNKLIGEPSDSYSGQWGRSSSAPKSRIVYAVSTSDTPTLVADLLQKEVSLYPHCKANTPSGTATIGQVVETFRVGGKFIPQIEAVRNEIDKEKRSKIKTGLPAVVPGSEPQTQRGNVHCTPNGIICLDFDAIPADELESAKQTITEVAYVFTVSLSVSGNGLFALAAYDGMPNLKNLLTAMQADFPYEIDKSCSDVSRLRFVTWDDNLIVKDEVFPAILTEQTEAVDDVATRDLINAKPDKPSRMVRSFDEISTELPKWFLQNKIPANDISIISGDGAVGKTYFVFFLAEHITRLLLMHHSKSGQGSAQNLISTSVGWINRARAASLVLNLLHFAKKCGTADG